MTNLGIFYIDTKVESSSSPLLEKYLNNESLINSLFNYTDIDNKFSNSCFHNFWADKRNLKNNTKLVEQYICGAFNNRITFGVKYLSFIKYYLLCSKRYKYLSEHSGWKYYNMSDIIQLPKQLYLLQLLENERFDLLNDDDILQLLDLYSFEKIGEFDSCELEKMDFCGVTDNVYPAVIKKADSDKKIVKLLK